ncbi:Glycogenin glucosyltransferase [Trichophyton interdigitale]|uniref:glycogenin glucosyltransferase n=1 Tax=Trichophyton interdigitale TaxID=101480 RepID=A0A9P5CX80_9EURO|nr:Glycogenin glucosyltransferase [Trichophyton interdigitale]KAG5205978.1 Glycogenin glucosyltransferase [Trichophyton interdigitale]KAG8210355.1 Glycogenin glucosyltransferase [Trichophyton interdigitale]
MSGHGAVYCTILLSDNYLPGAMVLAHSLRDNGTKGRLAVLVTPDTLQPGIIDELKTVYDDVIPIPRIENAYPGNLYLMDRPDLISTFSKIALWKQTQYDQIVYIDADVIALRAPDELLTLDVKAIAAVPDIGWPDCFNTGVMVLRPNLQDYYSLLAFAQRGISFDGADQGLLNMYFKNWDRLSFTYNCTPSGHYQYVPAYRYFESTISLVHFIGSIKPWGTGRSTSPHDSPYGQLLKKWWAVYDRHYRRGPIYITPHRHRRTQIASKEASHSIRSVQTSVPEKKARETTLHPPAEPKKKSYSDYKLSAALETDASALSKERYVETEVHTHEMAISQHEPVRGTYEAVVPSNGAPDAHIMPQEEPSTRPDIVSIEPMLAGAPGLEEGSRPSYHAPPKPMISAVPHYVRGEEHISVPIYHGEPPNIPTYIPHVDVNTQQPHPPHLPVDRGTESQESEVPLLTKEAGEDKPVDESATKYESVAVHTAKIQPPERTFSPPLAVWDASRAPPPVDSKPEAASFPVQVYTMSKDTELFQPPKSYPEAPKDMYYQVPTTTPAVRRQTSTFPWERSAPAPTRVFIGEDSEPSQAPEIPISSARQRVSSSKEIPSGGFESYSRNNAWDDMPEIEKYMRSLQKPRRAGVSVITGSTHARKPSTGLKSPARKSNLRQTHYPPEQDVPSPAVTPALVMRRPSTSSSADNHWENEELPAAEGVPNQAEWNPIQRLKELQRRQSRFLERHLDLKPQEAGGDGATRFQRNPK